MDIDEPTTTNQPAISANRATSTTGVGDTSGSAASGSSASGSSATAREATTAAGDAPGQLGPPAVAGDMAKADGR